MINMVNPRFSQFLTLLCTNMCRFVLMYMGTHIEKEENNTTHDELFWEIIIILMYVLGSLYPYCFVYILLHQNYTKCR